MYLTEQEIFSQYPALSKTLALMEEKSAEIKDFWQKSGCTSITFIGCGSSYSLAKSAALSARLRMPGTPGMGVPCYAFSAGDLLINFDHYRPILGGTLLVSISRSGSTSEVVLLVEKARAELKVPCLSICARADAPLTPLAGLNLEIPWAFDDSVCQTRCVTNLYAASILLGAVLGGDEALLRSVREAVAAGEAYQSATRESLAALAAKPWDKVVVLADGELEGIAEEGALAFTEICLLPSRYFHLLDVRHGPMVLVDDSTLVIAALSPGEEAHQEKLLGDMAAKGATLAVFSDRETDAPHAALNIRVPRREVYAANGIPFIFVCQALAFYKALERGVNPDAPTGLDPWIKL